MAISNTTSGQISFARSRSGLLHESRREVLPLSTTVYGLDPGFQNPILMSRRIAFRDASVISIKTYLDEEFDSRYFPIQGRV